MQVYLKKAYLAKLSLTIKEQGIELTLFVGHRSPIEKSHTTQLTEE